MSYLRAGYFSPNAAFRCGYSLYKNQEGDIVFVTEAVRPGQRPISNYDDMEYVGILETFIRRKDSNPLILLSTPMLHDDITDLERILILGSGKTTTGFCGKIKFKKEEEEKKVLVINNHNSSKQLQKILDPSPFKKYVRNRNLRTKNNSKRSKQIQNLPKKFKKRYR